MTFANPAGLASSPLPTYSRFSCVRAGPLVAVSGQLAPYTDGKVIRNDNLATHAGCVFERTSNLLLADPHDETVGLSDEMLRKARWSDDS